MKLNFNILFSNTVSNLCVIVIGFFILSCFNYKIKKGIYIQKTTTNIATPDTIFFFDKNIIKYRISNGLMSGIYNGTIDSTNLIIEKECFSDNLVDMKICYDTLKISYIRKNKIILENNRKFLYFGGSVPKKLINEK